MTGQHSSGLPNDLLTDEMVAEFAEDNEQVTRLNNTVAMQSQVIDLLRDQLDTANERAEITGRRFAAATEYIGWLERQLDAALLREQAHQ